MSNFSNIGFDVNSEQDLRSLVEHVLPQSHEYINAHGNYFCYTDPSGAMVWVQVNERHQITGVYPHFKGSSKSEVRLTSTIQRPDSAMEGG
ncbi:MAG: hypothetical protein AAFO69_11090, partial [Bacteroidota bacterium]